ncbi:hypothetical protein S7711_06290 [Stachybotrys chartarum IBT 7711]|uniref:Uncharacterized protein n=1 Tax=Stachybotrys chartarum (strain CBS 109288 / IBT 7711) TaxID=1280523 RepID=A0A084B835_STACB|nr:hypothetical protein S7711_06290 [Stachybotrys chartarum IBT 7711]
MEGSSTSGEAGKKDGSIVNQTQPPVHPPDDTEKGKAPAAEVEDVPDPDEDDLDDLDDMLDDFATVKLQSKSPAPTVPAERLEAAPKPAAAPVAEPALEQDPSEEDFAKQLQAGMASLLGELEKSPDMQAQFEDMFKQMSAAAGDAEGGAPQASGETALKTEAQPGEQSFQETIRRTMERMQSSGDQATAAAASGAGDDFMSEILKQLGSGDFGADGSDEDFSKMLMGMMEQLTNKDILYEPMKELNQKFPEWLDKNKSTTSAEDLKRYEEQRVVVAEIVAKFEEKTYSDSNAADREYIVDRMQKMQAAGSPPADLVGDMPSAQEAFNAPDEQCNPQ